MIESWTVNSFGVYIRQNGNCKVLTKTRNDLKRPTLNNKRPTRSKKRPERTYNDLERPITNKKRPGNHLQRARNNLNWPTTNKIQPTTTQTYLQQAKERYETTNNKQTLRLFYNRGQSVFFSNTFSNQHLVAIIRALLHGESWWK